jgi:hypothetical protein
VISRLRGTPVARRPRRLVSTSTASATSSRHAGALRLGGAAGEVSLETYLTCARTRSSSTGSPSERARAVRAPALGHGVGPKVALAIVSGSTPAELRRAIALEDTARFEAIPGIGKKTAQRVVLELKEKLGAGRVRAPAPGAPRRARRARRARLLGRRRRARARAASIRSCRRGARARGAEEAA